MTALPPHTSAPWPWIRTALAETLRLHRPLTNHTLVDLDVTAPAAALKALQQRHRTALSMNAFLLHCVSRTLAAYPLFNTYRHGNRLITFADVDVATTVDRRMPDGTRIAGLTIIRAAQTRSLAELTLALRAASKLDPTTMPEVRIRRRIARLPAPVRALIRWQLMRDPFRFKRYYGTTGVSSIARAGTTHRVQNLNFNPFTISFLFGTISGVDRQTLPLTGQIDHAIVDGMPAMQGFMDLAQRIESTALLTDDFAAEVTAGRSDEPDA